MSNLKQIISALRKEGSPEKAKIMMRFFKTGSGEYGEGDLFYGITVPSQRSIAKTFSATSTKEDIRALLESTMHEERLTALFILNQKFTLAQKIGNGKEWVDLYTSMTHRINNWDLVDSSAHIILGKWLEDKPRTLLYQYAHSNSLWENRIAMIATLHFIRKNDFTDTLKLAKILLNHPHDLIHKAVGWMLREIWNKAPDVTEQFLDKHAINMPRTMLRYAIEKMEEDKRLNYLKRKRK